jgi:phosphoenolpyruvate carboxykinase (GTP)
MIPKYEDLVPLFRQVLDKQYTEDNYVEQFTIRVPENLAKVDRVEKYHHENVAKSPPIVFEILSQQRQRLLAARDKCGDYISPLDLATP